MRYLKNGNEYATYVDPINRFTIRRGEIAAAKSVTTTMLARIRKGGLIEVSKEEYEAYVESKKPKKADAGEAEVAPPSVGETQAPEADAGEAKGKGRKKK